MVCIHLSKIIQINKILKLKENVMNNFAVIVLDSLSNTLFNNVTVDLQSDTSGDW